MAMELTVNANTIEELMECLRGIQSMIAEGYTSGYDGDATWDLKK